MQSMDYNYLSVGRADQLKGKDRVVYRLLEIIPGCLSWSTLAGVVLLSRFEPVWAAFFIIVFDLYWLVKTVYLSAHLRANWKRMKRHLRIDWRKRLENLKYGNIRHMVILPFYNESFDVVSASIESLIDSEWDEVSGADGARKKRNMMVVLAYEERGGMEVEKTAKKAVEKYAGNFSRFLAVKHPENLPGEIPGKSANAAYAAEEARKELLDKEGIDYGDVLVSAFDIDTRVYPQYFLCLTWHFLTCEKPYRSSFQPVPVYNNNIWEAPAFSRVVATSGTFWQMIQQERPERLATFSSHSMSFKALYGAGYWQKNIVSEDSRIFWTSFLRFNGDYRVVPISYPVSMDANLAPSFWQTAKNVYKQQRRWCWGVENVPYFLFGFLKNKKISLARKIRFAFVQIEGFWSMATNPLIIFLLGWLPLMLGGREFNTTLLSYNLPIMTRNIMTIAMLGLIMSAIISTGFLPKRPADKSRSKYIFMVIQWAMVPFTISIFGSIPALDAQTRLMLGKYMGFWVTPKRAKKRANEKGKDE